MTNKDFAELMQLFAELFKFPSKAFHGDIKNGFFDAEVAKLSFSAGIPITTDFEARTNSLEELIQSFNSCFLGKGSPFAPPIESVYKIWTTDQSYQSPHKNQKGHLMSDSALHIKYILETLGLKIPKEYEMMPDHLAILLEVYAFLYLKDMDKESADFLNDHLDWLTDFSKALQQINGADFYLYAVAQLQEILKMVQQTDIK